MEEEQKKLENTFTPEEELVEDLLSPIPEDLLRTYIPVPNRFRRPESEVSEPVNEETIKRLAYALKDAGVDKDTGVTISLRLRKPGKAEVLIAWLEQNSTATPEEICQKSREIAKSKIDAQFLKEALEEHAKAEADGTLYEKTRPRAGMRHAQMADPEK